MSALAMDAPSPAASWSRAYLAQLRAELLLLLRQGENLLVIVGLPVLLLVLFAGARIVPAGSGRPVQFLLPGILCLAVMSTGLVTLGISTAYQRYYRVLKRLGATPLPRSALVAAKASAVLVVEVAQVLLLLAIASLALGWHLHGSFGLAVLALGGGAVAFAGLGLTMAGGMRAELTLGGANGLYLVFLVLGGIVLPVSHLPGFIQPLARVLPPTALSSVLRAILQGGQPAASNIFLLAGWAIALAATAAWLFRWE